MDTELDIKRVKLRLVEAYLSASKKIWHKIIINYFERKFFDLDDLIACEQVRRINCTAQRLKNFALGEIFLSDLVAYTKSR
jgi:hypothetical protein